MLRGVPLPPQQVELRRRNAIRNNQAQYFQAAEHDSWWTAEELALLGTAPDAEVAERTGRTVNAVRVKRERLRLTKPEVERPGPHKPWSAKADEWALTLPPAEVARRTGRTLMAVYRRRSVLWCREADR